MHESHQYNERLGMTDNGEVFKDSADTHTIREAKLTRRARVDPLCGGGRVKDDDRQTTNHAVICVGYLQKSLRTIGLSRHLDNRHLWFTTVQRTVEHSFCRPCDYGT